MITILHFAHKFFPEITGTSERIFNSQPKNGYKHIIIKLGDNYKKEKYTEAFEIYTIPVKNLFKIGKLQTYYSARKLVKFAESIIKNEEISIIYGHNPIVFTFASTELKNRYPDIAFVYEPHDILYNHYLNSIFKKYKFVPKILKKYYYHYIYNIEKEAFTISDYIISQTESLKRLIIKIYNIENSKIVVAYNGLPKIKPNMEKNDIIRKYNIKTKSKIAIYGGYLSKNNGLDKIIKSIENNPEILFIIAGDGEYKDEIKKIKNNNLKFVGTLPKQEYINLLSISDVLLLIREPDLTNNNYLALKVLDAIALNKYILTTKLDIMKEMKENYHNIIFVEFSQESIDKNLKMITEFKNKKESINNTSILNWKTTQKVIDDVYKKIYKSV